MMFGSTPSSILEKICLPPFVRDGRVRLYTINGADWSKRYPLIVGAAARIQGPAILDAEVVWLDSDGMAQFDALHSRVNDEAAVACAFDLLIFDGDISDPGPLPSARQRYARHPGGHAEVFSTWSTPRATAGKCFKRFVSLVLKESSQRN
jgi:hypothetical protein